VSGPVFMFCAPDSFSTEPRASSPVYMFCASGPVLGGIVGVRSHFLSLRSWTRFGRYRGRRVPFSCFALTGSFWAVSGASGPISMFCALRLVFDGTVGAGSRFHVLRSRNRFRRYRGYRVLFSSFVLPDSFSTVPRASGPVFMFCAPEFIL
jgi:hypothetical protein